MKTRIQKRRQKAPTTKVTQRQKRVVKMSFKQKGLGSSELWDNKKTLTENYSRLGIVSLVNKPLRDKSFKRMLSSAEASLFPTRPLNEAEVFDTAEDEAARETLLQSIFNKSFSEEGDVSSPLAEIIQKKQESSKPRTTSKYFPPFLRTYIEKLIEIHGDSVKDMQNDLKHNYNQLTESRLRHLIARYKSIVKGEGNI